jgi:hypothetical protein
VIGRFAEEAAIEHGAAKRIYSTAPAPAPFVPADFQGKPVVAVVCCQTGPAEEAARDVAPLRRFGPPVADLIVPMPYTAVQQIVDGGAPYGALQVYLKSDHLADLGDEVIDVILAQARNVTSPQSLVLVFPLGRAVARVDESATAFGHRKAAWDYVVYSMWTDPAEAEPHVAWARAFAAAMQPFSIGAYVNEMVDEGEERVHAAYPPETYRRLVALKTKYDPTNPGRATPNLAPGRQTTGAGNDPARVRQPGSDRRPPAALLGTSTLRALPPHARRS